jgi:hypothetical protein
MTEDGGRTIEPAQETAIAAPVGWLLLPVPRGAPARRRILMLRPDLGIAVLEPGRQRGRHPAAALRRVLERVRFSTRHGGTPPIIRLGLGTLDAAALADALYWEFAAHPPLALRDPEGWPETVEAAFGARRAARPPSTAARAATCTDRPPAIRGPRRRSAPDPLPVRQSRRPRVVGLVLLAMAMLLALWLAAGAAPVGHTDLTGAQPEFGRSYHADVDGCMVALAEATL